MRDPGRAGHDLDAFLPGTAFRYPRLNGSCPGRSSHAPPGPRRLDAAAPPAQRLHLTPEETVELIVDDALLVHLEQRRVGRARCAFIYTRKAELG